MVRTLAPMLALALFLTGCSAGMSGEPEVLQSPATSTTPTGTPDVVEGSAAPASTKPSTPEGTAPAHPPSRREQVETFVDDWMEATTTLQTTGDPTDYQAIVSAKCEACQGVVDAVTSTFENDGALVGPGPFARNTKVAFPSPHSANVLVTVISPTVKWRKRAGGDVTTLKRSSVRYKLYLQRTKSGWQIDQYYRWLG